MVEEYTLTQRAVAEFLGMFSIVFFGAGAVVIDFLTVPESAGGEFVITGLGLVHSAGSGSRSRSRSS